MAPIAVAVVVLVPLFPAKSPIPVGHTSTPRFFASSQADVVPADSVTLVYPYPSGVYPGALVWQAVSRFRFKMVGGYVLVPQPPSNHIAHSQSVGAPI